VLSFFEDIFYTLGRHDNHVIIVAVYLCFAAVLVALRIIAYLHFRGVLLSFQHLADKEIKTKMEALEIKHHILKKAAGEYIRVAERAVTSVPTAQIVERAVSGMGLVGWKYTGLLPFVESFEFGLLGIGFVFAVIYSEQAVVYGLLAVTCFVAVRIFAAFFNVRAVRTQLSDEMTLFIEREIGRYFVSDTGGAILRLKNDLTDAIEKQAAVYKSAMKNALKEASGIFNEINTGAERLSQASTRIQSASDLLASHMHGHSNALSEQLITLVTAINEMKAGLQTLSASQKALTTQAEFIERNQKTLENSLNAYESSLQAVTQSIGDGLGAFINLHAQTSAQTINDAMKYNIDTMKNLMQGEK